MTDRAEAGRQQGARTAALAAGLARSRRTWRLALAAGVWATAGCVSVPVSVPVSAGGSPVPTGPAAPVPDLAQLERQVLAELNAARTAPGGYASAVESLIPFFEGRVLRRPGETAIRTQEGAAAVREAATALRAVGTLPALALSGGMTQAARDHARDQARGALGHAGSDGSTTATRVERYGRWITRLTESISYGPASGAAVVQGLIIDDGLPSRGHRLNLLDPAARVAGIGCGLHATYRVVCVIDLAGGYEER